jgi:YggT family protein
VSVLGRVLSDIVLVYILILIARAILETVMSVSRTFRPTGGAALVFEFVFTVTDPPLKALRRLIPPLRLGNAAIDIAFLVLIIALSVIRSVVLTQI